MEYKYVLHTYEIIYTDGRRELLQAHSMSHQGGMDYAWIGGGEPRPERYTFFRHPVGQVLIIQAKEIQSIRMLELDPEPTKEP